MGDLVAVVPGKLSINVGPASAESNRSSRRRSHSMESVALCGKGALRGRKSLVLATPAFLGSQLPAHPVAVRKCVPLGWRTSSKNLCPWEHLQHCPSSFHGDARELEQQRPWPKEMIMNEFTLNPFPVLKGTVDVDSFHRPFESNRLKGNYLSPTSQLPAALQPQFPSPSVDQRRTRDLNAPANLDESASSSTLEVIRPSWKANSMPRLLASTISQHRAHQASSPNNGRPLPRFETGYPSGDESLPTNRIASSNLNPNFSKPIESEVGAENGLFSPALRSPDGGANLLSNSHATQMSNRKSKTGLEPASMVSAQAKSFRNGAYPTLNKYPIPACSIVGSVVKQMSGVTKAHEPSLQPVPQELDAARDQWKLQNMVVELYGREAQSEQPTYRREAGALARFRGVRDSNNIAQLRAPFPQTRPEAAKSREAVKVIDRDRNASRKAVGEIESSQQNNDSLKVEFKRKGNVKANLTRSKAGNDVLDIRDSELLFRKGEEESCGNSEGVTEMSARQDLLTEGSSRKAHWIDDRALMIPGLTFLGRSRLQSRASCGSRDRSRKSEQGHCSTDVNSAVTASHASAVLQNRLQQGTKIDSYTYVKVLQLCSKQRDLSAANQVHDCIIQSGMDKNEFVTVTLLDVYIKCGALPDARRVLDQLDHKSVATWTNMISGYAKSDDPESAVELLNHMRQEGAEPNEITYLSILNACASPSALKWGKEIHECIRRAGFESDVRVGTALLKMYANCGCIMEAWQVFDTLTNRDAITWTVMIGGLAQHGYGHDAYRLFRQMKRKCFVPSANTYVSILNASASAGAMESVKEAHEHARKAGLESVLTLGKKIHECIRHAGLESDIRVATALLKMYANCGSITEARRVFDSMSYRDVITWTAMIGGLAQHGRGHEAYRLFRRMRREGFEPNAITYMSILNASASAGALQWVKEVHGFAKKEGLGSDLRVGSALIHMYAESGSIDEARLVFEKMEKRDVVTWTTMIGELASHGCGHEALALFTKMNAHRVKPNRTTFVAVLSACSHGGLVDDGRRLFSAMREDFGVEPDIMHYTCMVDLLGRAGLLEEAKRFIDDMPLEPSDITWKALLGACRTYGNVELGELAAKELFKLEPNEASGYVLLSNIYAAAGKWEKVSSVRTTMQERRIRKEAGRSWIEIDNKVHEFVVGDTSHPEAKAIYSELNKLNKKLKAEGYIPDTRNVLHDINEKDKELALCLHSEKLAIAYGLIHTPRGKPIRVTKNLRVCPDCHTATKFISKVTGREIIARDANRFHHFKDGVCSCGDYW